MSGSATPLIVRQGQLFAEEPSFDASLTGLRRTDLGRGAWIDQLPEWVRGHDAVLETLWVTTRWEAHRRRMYERIVDVPRLVAGLPDDGPGHPLIPGLAEALTLHYGRSLHRVSLAAYRDGRDSVAFHGDKLGAARNDAIVAIVGLGGRRRPPRDGRHLSAHVGARRAQGGARRPAHQRAIPLRAHRALSAFTRRERRGRRAPGRCLAESRLRPPRRAGR